MNVKLGIIMDAIETIDSGHDTGFAMLCEAKRRGWELHYMQQHDLYWSTDQARARSQQVDVFTQQTPHFAYGKQQDMALADFDVLLMRLDPPFNLAYIYTTYLLDHAKANGVLVINDPAALRNNNEKFTITHFSNYCTPTLISSDSERVDAFYQQHQDIIVKPLDGMGGNDVFRIHKDNDNLASTVTYLTQQGNVPLMAQRYIPEISRGDKRIIVIDGEPVEYALARFPAKGSVRANLAAGGTGKVVPLTERDREICRALAPKLREDGVMFAGVDVIGAYLTEVNITSPTCVCEIEAGTGVGIMRRFFDGVEEKLNK